MSTKQRYNTLLRCGGLFLFTLMALPVRGQIQLPEGVPDLIVEDCEDALDEAVRCIVGRLCFDITDVLTVETFPDFADVVDCIDLEEPLCPIIGACPACEEDISALFLCQFVGVGTVSNATDIVEECSPLIC